MSHSEHFDWYSNVYLRDPYDVNIYLSMSQTTGDSPARMTATRTQGWYIRLREYSLQDLIALSVPYMIILLVVAIGTCYISDPSMPVLLYSGLPKSYQSWLTFVVLFVQEMRLLLTLGSVFTPVIQLQVLSFDAVIAHLEGIANSAAMNRYFIIFTNISSCLTALFTNFNIGMEMGWSDT